MKRLKFIVEQGGETKAAASVVEYGVILVENRLYRHPRGTEPPKEARHLWFSTFRPSGWESFPIWPGTETDEIEVRARLEVDEDGDLVLMLNDDHASDLTYKLTSAAGITTAIEERLQDIREGKP